MLPCKSQNCICHIVSFSITDRQSALETELRTVQTSRRDLENLTKWLQEAETTVNVLADASQRENALQDSILARQLRQQMLVSEWQVTGNNPLLNLCPPVWTLIAVPRWSCPLIQLWNPCCPVNNWFLGYDLKKTFILNFRVKIHLVLWKYWLCM